MQVLGPLTPRVLVLHRSCHRAVLSSMLCIMMQFPDREEPEKEEEELLVTFGGSGGSLENVASHDGGGAVNCCLALIVYGSAWGRASFRWCC